MGMAASQARLLSLTARIHDVEQQAQSIQNAKIQLATQSDQVYQDYLEALDATTLALNYIDPNSAEKGLVATTFNNLCSRNQLRAADGTMYALRNSQGLLIVEDDIYEAYHNVNASNAQEFAMYLLFGEVAENLFSESAPFGEALEAAEITICESNREKNEELNEIYEDLLAMIPPNVPDNPTIYDIPQLTQTLPEGYEEKLAQFRNLLYSRYSGEIYQELWRTSPPNGENIEVPEIDLDLFNYYVSIYNQIEYCGGCISINDYSGPNGNAANDAEWLTNMVQSGLISIEEIKIDSRTGDVSLRQQSPASDTCLSYVEKSSIDNRALAKAEAKYEHDLEQINKKDKKFDLDLSKLETERSALTKEYDSVKNVIKQNVERTFGIFS